MGVGEHTVAVQARFFFNSDAFPLGSTYSTLGALIGPKTLTVEGVNLKD